MIRVVFLIDSLHRGGAEKQLTLLVRGLDHSRFHCTVVTIYDGGELAQELNGIANVQVLSVHKGGRGDSLQALLRLGRLMRRLNPDLVHGYMDSANVLALITGKPVRAQVVWGVRSSSLESIKLNHASRFYRRLGALLSTHADLVIANSQAGRAYATSIGYPAGRVMTIPNGFETERFVPDHLARSRVRTSWVVNAETPVIGLVARLDPVKDHPTFLRAASLLAPRLPNARFVCVGGGGSPEYAQQLKQLAQDLSIDGQVIWTGETTDMPATYNGLDVASLVSTSEGFANAVGEAMACGVPCVVTDIGDSAAIVGDTGIVIRPGDPAALSDAWYKMLTRPTDERAALGTQARKRILDHYSVATLVERTSRALLTLVNASVPPSTDELILTG